MSIEGPELSYVAFRPQGPATTAPPIPIVPRQPSLDPISDGIRDHYLAQARSADQVRGMIAASTRPMDEDDGA